MEVHETHPRGAYLLQPRHELVSSPGPVAWPTVQCVGGAVPRVAGVGGGQEGVGGGRSRDKVGML